MNGLFGFLSILVICGALIAIFEGKLTKKDPLAQQIEQISEAYPYNDKASMEHRDKLISELIRRYNPTNTMSEIEAK